MPKEVEVLERLFEVRFFFGGGGGGGGELPLAQCCLDTDGRCCYPKLGHRNRSRL